MLVLLMFIFTLGSLNSIGRVLGPSIGGFAYVISMLLPYLGSAAIALVSVVIVRIRAPGDASLNIRAAPATEDI